MINTNIDYLFYSCSPSSGLEYYFMFDITVNPLSLAFDIFSLFLYSDY